jgi:hypothetical protein
VFKMLLFPFKDPSSFVKLAGVRARSCWRIGVAIGLLIAPSRAPAAGQAQGPEAPSSVPGPASA